MPLAHRYSLTGSPCLPPYPRAFLQACLNPSTLAKAPTIVKGDHLNPIERIGNGWRIQRMANGQ
ncbi:MAG: hypothetical protein VW491_07625, partial [Gammaproteobacteria bacterium]